ASLPAGHHIDMACGVRFGILGEPIAADRATDAPAVPVARIPEGAGRQLAEALGGPFLVFRARVQKELKLSAEQRATLGRHLRKRINDTRQMFGKLQRLKPVEREKEHPAQVHKAREALAAFLQKALKPEQLKRLG